MAGAGLRDVEEEVEEGIMQRDAGVTSIADSVVNRTFIITCPYISKPGIMRGEF